MTEKLENSSFVCIHLISKAHLGIHALLCTLLILCVTSKGARKKTIAKIVAKMRKKYL